MISDKLKEEIIKIIIEKGLSVVIILLVTFYVTKLIENYKAKLVYTQKFAELRMTAYSELLSLLLLHNATLKKYRQLLLDIEIGLEANQDLLTQRRDDFLKTLIELEPLSRNSMLYISPRLLSKLSEHIQIISADSLSELEDTLRDFQDYQFISLDLAQQMIIDEVEGGFSKKFKV